MSDKRTSNNPGAPSTCHDAWHPGERRMQELVGSAEVLERAASLILRASLSDQMRAFFPRLPFLAIGFVDAVGDPWGTLLPGPAGFVWSPDPTLLRVDRAPPEGDPLAKLLHPGLSVGLLGIELSTRRRNRVNGVVHECDATGFSLRVEQCFGNCAQYIQRREATEASSGPATVEAQPFRGLDPAVRQLLATSDTLFVTSFAPGSGGIPAVDIWHRGGPAGFVRADGNALTIPDFLGNRYFNTLGNILAAGRAGIVVPDFDSGDLLLLTGDAGVGFTKADREEAETVTGAERLWRLSVRRGLWLRGALPPVFRFRDWSPQALATGAWPSP